MPVYIIPTDHLILPTPKYTRQWFLNLYPITGNDRMSPPECSPIFWLAQFYFFFIEKAHTELRQSTEMAHNNNKKHTK